MIEDKKFDTNMGIPKEYLPEDGDLTGQVTEVPEKKFSKKEFKKEKKALESVQGEKAKRLVEKRIEDLEKLKEAEKEKKRESMAELKKKLLGFFSRAK
jgi:hypothetical protein